jgi:small subunit ribosomal protein S20
VRSEVKTFTKKFDQVLQAGDKEASAKALQEASKKLDVAVSKGVLHKNSAANRKSSMARQLSSS